MKILCFGSMNIDYVYEVDHFVRNGETLASKTLRVFSGGKGLNQSVAMAKAGLTVYQAGAVNPNDSQFLIETLSRYNVNTDFIQFNSEVSTGHAIIQVDSNSDNCILLHGGANKSITKDYVDYVIEHFNSDDAIVLQNEINELEYIIKRASKKGLKIFFNPSPFTKEILDLPLGLVDYFIMNELEIGSLLDSPSAFTITSKDKLLNSFPKSSFIITLGSKGAHYISRDYELHQEIFKADVIDTTGAGDTFTGYFISGIIKGRSIDESMKLASKASSITVSRKGAANSIPELNEICFK